MLRILTAHILLLMFAGGAFAKQDVISWNEDVKGWTIAVDTTSNDACFMYMIYENGTFLRIQIEENGQGLDFIIGDEDWLSLEIGKLYPLEVEFGNKVPWEGDADALFIGDTLPAIRLPVGSDNSVDFATELMQMTTVKVRYSGKELAHLSLRGSYAAMLEVLNCQENMNNRNNKNIDDPFSLPSAGDDPFS